MSASPRPSLSTVSVETLPQLGGNIIKGAVGLFGMAGIFYGAGFLALRSHFAFLGIWSGVPSNSDVVAEEGGRFFFHLVLLPAGIITQGFSSLHFALPYTVLVLLLAASFWDGRRWLFGRRAEASGARTSASRALYAKVPALYLTAALVLTTVLLFPEWQVTSVQDAARAPNSIPGEMVAALQDRAGLYNQVVIRLAAAIAIACFLYQSLFVAGHTGRVFMFAQWLLVLAALVTLPVVYGRLILPTTYPIFSFSGASPDERLLIEETPGAWIIWNCVLKQTEIVPKDKAPAVAIGARKSLLP
jgi:hypothetical protein